MPQSRVLVAGATGQLGSVIARKLVAAGVPVRALARNREELAAAVPGVEVAAIDLLDVAALTEACGGVDQIVGTANNNMGKDPTSPTRVDLTGYQNLCAAARNTGVRRLVYVCYRGVEQARRSISSASSGTSKTRSAAAACRTSCCADGVHGHLGGSDHRQGHSREGRRDDVRRRQPRRQLHRGRRRRGVRGEDPRAATIVNEVIEAGGPSNLSLNELVTMVERRLESSGKRRHMPARRCNCCRHLSDPSTRSPRGS